MTWTVKGARKASPRLYSANGAPPPRRIVTVDDTAGVAAVHRLIGEGNAVLWRGDYPGARSLLAALGRRVERRGPAVGRTPAEMFRLHREEQSRRARLLGRLLIPYESDWRIPLRRAPWVQEACTQAYGPCAGPGVGSLRELLGVIGAYEWRKKGVEVPALGGGRIHPHYGVFSPVRGEYVDLVAETTLPLGDRAFDIGTGTGVLSVVLARRGLRRIIATDHEARAVACARDNASRLGLADTIDVRHADLFPEGRAHLIVCNPPWLPGHPRTLLDQAVYDQDSRTLKRFLTGLPGHLEPGGEGWLILSDLPERLGLRERTELADTITAAGLRVLSRKATEPRHRRAKDPSDPLHRFRAAEVTSLWRLGVA
ncbi:methyltransferase [Streptomyces venezuelae]|uniref:Methyltransferase n=1 Tax=Streptomyces venezuelae TaxID=54571 RepID=A0A5P2DAV4_STRVZ|nr:class I SAM-dependent methyltransferase [Streptomyces venezuelae]QES51218.1 methyltransferase [Streptomyces venezuelae]